MTRLCTYVVRQDTGLAPNPYWGWCTVAVCTPNHQGARLSDGDWIAGFLTKENAHRFLYAMVVSERICLHEYFHDPRFSDKIPDLRGDWKQRCGDNFYSRDKDGEWRQHRNGFHLGPQYRKADTRRPFAFVAEKFWYLGRKAADLPAEFRPLVGGRGIRVNHPPELVREFHAWVEEFDEGVQDLPNDNPDCTDAV